VAAAADDPRKAGNGAGNGAGDGATQPTTEVDIFANLENLRLKQDFNRAQIKRPFTNCPIRKPRKHEWFQVHQEHQLETSLFALKEGMGSEWYLPVGEEVASALDPNSLYPVIIFTWINRKKEVAIWPVPLHDIDGRDNDWWSSMREMMGDWATKGQWIRIRSGNQGYELEIAENDKLAPPAWPEVDFNTILRTAFKGGRVIDSLDHTVIQNQMRGSV
jgi:hypothetical protein